MPSASNQPTGKLRLAVLFNPESGIAGRRLEIKLTASFSGLQAECDFISLKEYGLEELIAKWRSGQKPDRVAVCGGDGTLRRVAQALFLNGLDLPIAFLPAGSANIFARSLGLSLDLKEAAETAVKGRVEAIDIGLVNGHSVFLIAAVWGRAALMANAATRADKKYLGYIAYLKHLPKLIGATPGEAPAGRTEKQGGIPANAHSLIVVNHLDLPPLNTVRAVSHTDGKLDAFALSGYTPIGWLKSAFSYFRSRFDTPELHHWAIEEMRFSAGERFGDCHLDGDQVQNENDLIEIKTIPRGINIIL